MDCRIKFAGAYLEFSLPARQSAGYHLAVTYDVKITGGRIVDGTGLDSYVADIGIKDGKIVEIGKLADAPAKKEIKADGAIVTPGFVDVHTHYDGQVSWDADFAPSSLHGVTTAVMGSCGVGFAPVKEHDQERIIKLMEGVEDIPGSALSEGITWGWESFPEYMDKIDSFPHTIDFAAQVPHDVVRVFAMGDRALHNEPATDEDIELMRTIVSDALDAGAVGFTTGRSDNHRTADGDPTPASESLTKELIGIVKAFEGKTHGVVQAVSDFDILDGDERFHEEFDILESLAAAAGDHPFSMSVMQRDQSPNQWKWIMERCEAASKKGVKMHMQVAPRPIGVILGLQATFNPFVAHPSYQKIAGLSVEERVKAMKDPAFKKQMLSEDIVNLAGEGSSIPPLADLLLRNIDKVSMRMYRLGETPDYEPKMDTCLYKEAITKGVSVLDLMYDILLEDDGKAFIYFPIYNYTNFSLDNVHKMLTHPLSIPGLSDGGAHVGTICDASFPTYYMQHWGRDREKGKIKIETIIQSMTQRTAKYLGFSDRGELKVGKKADINIIDFDNLKLHPPNVVADLPAGGKRLMQHADGYLATLVSGEVIQENGKLTGKRPGRLVRSGQL